MDEVAVLEKIVKDVGTRDEYIVHNGMMKDLSVLQEAPFMERGSVAEIFKDFNAWVGIRKVIEKINTNAVA